MTRSTARTPITTKRPWQQLRPVPDVRIVPGQLIDCDLLTDSEVEVLAVPIAPAVEDGDDLQPRHGTVDAALRYGVDFAELAHRAKLTGQAGQAHIVDLPRPHGRTGPLPWLGLPERVILLGVGSGDAAALRRAGAGLARATRGSERVLTTVAGSGTADETRAFVEGYLLASYVVETQRTGEPTPGPAAELVLLGAQDEHALDAARRGARGTWLARDLANTPSNVKNPQWLAERAKQLGQDAGLQVEVLDRPDLVRDGFGGIVAVGAGSNSEPRLVMVSYNPIDLAPETRSRHVVIVGKGITYDTGGISIKPRLAMVPMKTDMTGAGVALATVLAAAEAGLKHRVTAVLPLAENHFGADSFRPGDVLTIFGGRSVEISNTDAEGRLVLADALAYADAHLDPDILIDVATLTGAATLGLGREHGALFSPDARLVRGLEAAATRSGEYVWHMPLVDEYGDAIASSVADLSHVPLPQPGIAPHGAGSITAALFLREFVGSRRWAHIDIAGPARAGSDRHEVTEGATGFGVRLLLRFLENLR